MNETFFKFDELIFKIDELFENRMNIFFKFDERFANPINVCFKIDNFFAIRRTFFKFDELSFKLTNNFQCGVFSKIHKLFSNLHFFQDVVNHLLENELLLNS